MKNLQSCARCGKLADLEVTLVVTKGKKQEWALCKDCRAELLGESVSVCTSCGLRWEDLKSTKLLGCPDCYTIFESKLLSRAHRSGWALPYSGPSPSGAAGLSGIQKLKALKIDLELAVSQENFELAARLRDEIKKLEGQQQ